MRIGWKHDWKRKKYFIIFVDDCSDYVYVYLMKSKSDVFDMFKLFIKKKNKKKKLKLVQLKNRLFS